MHLAVNWHYLAKHETRKLYFWLKCCLMQLQFNQSLPNFFNLFDSRLILMLLYDSINLVIDWCVQLRAVAGHGSGERKSKVLQHLDCFARTVHQCTVFWVFSCTIVPKIGGLCPFFGGELGPHITQTRLGQGLPPYQVASLSIQPFGHNGHWPKIGGLPF